MLKIFLDFVQIFFQTLWSAWIPKFTILRVSKFKSLRTKLGLCRRWEIFLEMLPVSHTHAASEACSAESCILDPAEEKMCTLNKQIPFFFHFRAFIKHRHWLSYRTAHKKIKIHFISSRKNSLTSKRIQAPANNTTISKVMIHVF